MTKTASGSGDKDTNPYLLAQSVEYSLLDAANRNAQSWRRAFYAAVFLTIAAVMVCFVLATKDHTEAIVYKEDSSGDLALIGKSAVHSTPSDLSVKHQLVAWLTCARTIPGDDPDLVQQNAVVCLSMIARNSPAVAQYSSFITEQNPLTFGKRGFKRTVQKVEVTQISDLTYHLAWTETFRQGDTAARADTFAGTVTLAAKPRIPSDPVIGQTNPAGVFINSWDIPWGTIAQ